MFPHLRRVTIFAALAAIAVVHGGCASEPSAPDSDPDPDPGPDPNPQVTGVVIASPSNTLDVGTTLQLQATVQPPGAPQGVTWSVGDTHVASVNSSGLVSGLNPGPVTVTATSVANPAYSATLQLNCTCPPPRIINTAPPPGDTTWEDWIPSMECVDYVVNPNITVSGGLLTIEPGVVAAFEAGRMLRISSTGGLSAAGTAQEPIILTGVQPTRGYWSGVYLDASGHASNQITHTTIEYAGIASLSGSIRRANLILRDATVALSDLTLRESAAYGLAMHGNVTLSAPFTGSNVFTRNSSGPAYAPATLLRLLPGADVADYTGNDVDRVTVSMLNMTGDHTWRYLDVPILIDGGVPATPTQNLDKGSLTIEPGVELHFTNNAGFRLTEATLTAVGTAALPIIMRGDGGAPWRGINIHETSTGTFDYFQIHDGGTTAWGGSGGQAGNITLTAGTLTAASASFGNNIIRSGAGYGLVFGGSGTTTATNCDVMAPIYVPPSQQMSQHCN